MGIPNKKIFFGGNCIFPPLHFLLNWRKHICYFKQKMILYGKVGRETREPAQEV
jgi:hypothetical protein